MFHVNLNHSSSQAKRMPEAKPSSWMSRSMSALMRMASCSEWLPWSRPIGPMWAIPSELGTPNSVIATA